MAIAFDSEGNLWGSVFPEISIMGYRSADLKVGGTPASTWTLTGNCETLDSLCAPFGVAFDAEGNLWVADRTGIKAFSGPTRTGPNDGGPGGTGPLADFLVTTSCEAREFDAGGANPECDRVPSNFQDAAFDATGNLYGATSNGGQNGYGAVFEVTR